MTLRGLNSRNSFTLASFFFCKLWPPGGQKLRKSAHINQFVKQKVLRILFYVRNHLRNYLWNQFLMISNHPKKKPFLFKSSFSKKMSTLSNSLSNFQNGRICISSKTEHVFLHKSNSKHFLFHKLIYTGTLFQFLTTWWPKYAFLRKNYETWNQFQIILHFR